MSDDHNILDHSGHVRMEGVLVSLRGMGINPDHPCIPKIRRQLHDLGEQLVRGEEGSLLVEHDALCPYLLQDGSLCQCNPDIVTVPPEHSVS